MKNYLYFHFIASRFEIISSHTQKKLIKTCQQAKKAYFHAHRCYQVREHKKYFCSSLFIHAELIAAYQQ